MGSVIDKLNYLEETKTQLKDSLIAKGASITDETPLSEYAPAIENIQSGGGAQLNIAFGENPPEDTTKLWVKSEEKNDVTVTQSSEWIFHRVSDTKLPEASDAFPSVTVGSKIYMFGGTSSTLINTIRVFDTKTETITTLSSKLPSAVMSPAVALVGTKAYIFGGTTTSAATTTISKFDTETETRTTLSVKIPKALKYPWAVAVGTKIYLLGGQVNSTSTYSQTIYEFDAITETIRALDYTLPVGINRVGAAAIDANIYVFGGYTSTGSIKSIVKIDTLTGDVQTLTCTLPKATSWTTAAVIGTKIYLFGGEVASSYGSDYLNTINVFDTVTETISTLGSRLNRSCITNIGVVGETIYVFGGFTGGLDSKWYDTIDVYNMSGFKYLNQLVLTTEGTTSHQVTLINSENRTLQTSIGSVYTGSANGTCTKIPAYVYENGEWVEI